EGRPGVARPVRGTTRVRRGWSPGISFALLTVTLCWTSAGERPDTTDCAEQPSDVSDPRVIPGPRSRGPARAGRFRGGGRERGVRGAARMRLGGPNEQVAGGSGVHRNRRGGGGAAGPVVRRAQRRRDRCRRAQCRRDRGRWRGRGGRRGREDRCWGYR